MHQDLNLKVEALPQEVGYVDSSQRLEKGSFGNSPHLDGAFNRNSDKVQSQIDIKIAPSVIS